ncbi:MAG: Wzz/FepE/Etk N-terminal domain-containing protein [Pseudomonadota bacterium]|nr:Wzz/FepE/Etk N-terminal domain-containing protein [Pseudomonadota bacterium]
MNDLESLPAAEAPGWVDVALLTARHRWLLLLGPLLAAGLAFAITFAFKPQFTAHTSFLPPQQSQNAAAAALASLGALSNLVGAGGISRTPADQYVALMQSANVTDRLIDEFHLMQVYDEPYRSDAREELARRVAISVGKKDGLISVAVTDTDPKRAAAMANRHVEELRRLSDGLALTEAQQRRAFFETQLKTTRDRLTAAEQSLQASGFNAGALRAEPKAAAEGYAQLKAEVSAAEARLQVLRRGLADSTPEVSQQVALLSAMRGQLRQLESNEKPAQGADYVARYREFKYEESLFELLARQYELARLDEAREGALIQVIDVAVPPEKKSKPRRGMIAATTGAATLLLLLIGIVTRHAWRQARVARTAAVEPGRLEPLQSPA